MAVLNIESRGVLGRSKNYQFKPGENIPARLLGLRENEDIRYRASEEGFDVLLHPKDGTWKSLPHPLTDGQRYNQGATLFTGRPKISVSLIK
ncbi:MAG: hypothetical protein M1365_01240 [Actinobacteria bacterium]|nr:hypothetical protein [Actinomycetota bacterium]